MTMRYCPSCATGHDCEAEETGREKAEVAIERLRTQRDIEVARIEASAGVKIADSEAVQAAAHAEGMIEGAGAIIDAVVPEPPETDGAPVIVQAGTAEPDAEPEPDLTPPEIDTSVTPEKANAGWWDGYR